MRADTEEWATKVRDSILAAIVKKSSAKSFFGPFSLDDILQAWLEHERTTVAKLPDPPGKTGATMTQRRNYWFYEGCHALEEEGFMAEVGDGKFAIASLKVLVSQLLHVEPSTQD